MPENLISISSAALTAEINLFGAELWSLRDAAGCNLMTDADPRWWTGRAPLLFPIVGGLNGNRYRLADRSYDLPKHGFARRRAFRLFEKGDGFVILRLEADEETRAAYPFDFRLDMTFAVEGATLFTTATIINEGHEPMPFSFGFHPAFAWPLPYGGSVEAHHIVFESQEPAPIRRLDVNGLIAAAPQPSPVEGHILAPTHEMFERDALIWDQLASRSLIWGVPGRPGLKIDFPDTPWLGVWQKPGAPYLCIEPWAGMADPADFAGDFRDKPGVMMLMPGQAKAFRMDVTLTGV